MIFLRNKWLIHGIILVLMVVFCFFNIQFIILWNIGYAVYFAACSIIKTTKDLKPPFLKIITIALLTAGAAPGVGVMCIPSWFVCVVHSIKNPEYAENLAEYEDLKNAAYYRNYNCYAYEGDIEEKDLHRKALLNDWKLTELKKPETIYYTASSMIKNHEKSNDDFADIKVEDGLFYDDFNGSDCGARVVWNRKSKRLYFYSSLR